MPQSKKRKKKDVVEVTNSKKKTENIVKRPLGKIVIITLSFGFIMSVLVSLIYTLVQVMNS